MVRIHIRKGKDVQNIPNLLCFKAEAFTYLNDMVNMQSNELLGNGRQAVLPVTCAIVKYYDQMSEAQVEYANSITVESNNNLNGNHPAARK